jgi:hypothetical protein
VVSETPVGRKLDVIPREEADPPVARLACADPGPKPAARDALPRRNARAFLPPGSILGSLRTMERVAKE